MLTESFLCQLPPALSGNEASQDEETGDCVAEYLMRLPRPKLIRKQFAEDIRIQLKQFSLVP